jgi:hypothetical protein
MNRHTGLLALRLEIPVVDVLLAKQFEVDASTVPDRSDRELNQVHMTLGQAAPGFGMIFCCDTAPVVAHTIVPG